MIHLLDDYQALYCAAQAQDDYGGAVCATETLTLARLKEAYPQGLFPWYSAGEPVIWYSPNPRAVLPTAGFKLNRSLRKTIKAWQLSGAYEVRLDCATAAVMDACAQRAEGTWISPELKAAYLAWAAEGAVHSVELYHQGVLSGGFYGVSLGRMFFGESMFSRITDASKVALAVFCQALQLRGVDWIDCQQATAHLQSLGAVLVPRAEFVSGVAQRVSRAPLDWAALKREDLLQGFQAI